MKRYNKQTTRFLNKTKALVGSIIIALAATSCDDFLTIYPTNSVVLENYWKEKADVEGMVANCYRSMIQLGFMERFLVWGEVRSDNVMEGDNNSLGGDLRNVNEVNLMPTNGYSSWAPYYQVINNCNIVMKYAPEVAQLDPDYTQGDLKNHKGQMLAMRALCHLYLVRTFRDIPLQLTAIVDDSQDLYPAQVSPLVALDSIIVDLEEAYDLVMISGGYATAAQNKGRITKDAVAAILADAYLWRATFTQHYNAGDAKPYYTQCIEWCDRVIDARRTYMAQYIINNTGSAYRELANEKYPLVKSYYKNREIKVSGDLAYNEVFGSSMNSIPESIFELQLTGDVENFNYLVPALYGREKGQNAPFVVGRTLLSKYELTDYRRESFIKAGKSEEEASYICKYTTNRADGVFTADGTEPMQPEYRTTFEQSDKNKANHGKRYLSNCNWILYRLSDVMLMKAEALAYRNGSGDLDNAFELVEAVYYRSNDKELLEEKNALLNKENYNNATAMQTLVLDERQRELAFEGKRWFDLVRKALRTTKENADGETVNDISATVDIIVAGKYLSNPKSYKNKFVSIDNFFFPIYERDINTYGGEHKGKLNQNPAYETESTTERN